MSTQRATSCCDCGAVIDVTPTDSAWEFSYQCRACPRQGTISWFHGAEPPAYQVSMQRGLFLLEGQ